MYRSLFAFFAIFSAGLTLQAAQVTVGATYGASKTTFTTPITVAQFDSSLGVLTSIDLTVTERLNASTTFTNNSGADRKYGFSVIGTVTLFDFSLNRLLTLNSVFTDPAFSVSNGARRTDSGTSALNSATASLTSGLSAFEGTGTVSLSLKGQSETKITGYQYTNALAGNTEQGVVSIVYHYTPAGTTAPEPESAILVAVPLAAVLTWRGHNRPRCSRGA